MWTRVCDIVVSVTVLAALIPLMIVTAILIKVTTGGPVLYRGRRMGIGGRVFSLHKFRTMVEGADQSGPGITAAGDPRVTPIGKWLRRRKIDEIPQLFNVIRGEMSLVGPRPEDPRYRSRYRGYEEVLHVKPGITSPATLQYRKEEALLVGLDWTRVYSEEILPKKLEAELDYLKSRTLWTDIGVLVRTGIAVLLSREQQTEEMQGHTE